MINDNILNSFTIIAESSFQFFPLLTVRFYET